MPTVFAYKILLVITLVSLAGSTSIGAYYYQARVNDLNDQVSKTSDLNSQLLAMNVQLDSLKTQIDNLSQSNSSGINARVELLETQVKLLQIEVQSLQDSNQLQAGEIQQLQAQVAQLQTEVQQLQNLNPVVLNGAGATFPAPLLSAAAIAYNHLNPNIQVNYAAIGSGGGIVSLINKLVDFAASDSPLANSQRAAAPNSLHIPETIGAVTIAYNLPGISKGLRLDGSTIAKIFQGNITYWDDAAISGLNPALTLPHQPIVYVHRSDGSGTTFIFTKFLNASDPCPNGGAACWRPGVSTSIIWPGNGICQSDAGFCPIGAVGNAGVGGVVQGTPYTIGYLELNYALCPSHNQFGCVNGMPVAYVQNASGTFVQPSLANVTYAVQNSTATIGSLPPGDASWSSVNLLNAAGANSYPIVSFSYILVYKELNVVPDLNQASAKALVAFLWWLVHDGQALASSLFYVPLPQSVVVVDEVSLRSMTFNGQTLYP